jgi:uncharacterized protein involved in response to NO
MTDPANRQKTASLWQLGFRPFFLLGSLHAALAMAIWVSFLAGGWAPRMGGVDPVLWHSHEMVYGFSSAIVIGFVLTAAQNWTGRQGVHGATLQFLVGIWALARVAITLPGIPPLASAAVDLSLYPAAACLLIPSLKDPDLKAERLFFILFALLFAGNLLVHLETTGQLVGYGRQGVALGLNTLLVMIVFMGGRVIPFFTESSVARAQPKTWGWIESMSHLTAALFLIVDFFAPYSAWGAAIALSAAGIHFLRLWGWQVRRIRRIPLLWVLHLAYLWLVIGFALSGLASLGMLQKSIAVHAFTVGCLGTMIYGMISRVSLGHTGRRLHPKAAVVVGYCLLLASALTRVLGPVVLPSSPAPVLIVSGGFWIGAFAIFLWVYSPMLLAPRVDGRPG